MAVSKRLRYEILRRDNRACRYCGAAAPDVKLTVDHVTPTALGGTDTPDNLVTACESCNSGKTSSTPDASLVADVADDALRWAAAMKQAAENLLEQEKPKHEYRDAFLAEWKRWHVGKDDAKKVPLDDNWKQRIERFRIAGVPASMWADIVDTGMANKKVTPENTFRYCCGIAWNKVTSMQDEARRILTAPAEAPSASADQTRRDMVSCHLYATWAWAWERMGAGSPSEADIQDFMQDLTEMLERGLSAHVALTEQMYRAGSDHATDPSSYLPDEYKTPEQPAAQLPLTDEQYENGAGALNLWTSRWNEMSPDGGPTSRDEKEFLKQLATAVRAGHERDWILNAADLAGGFLNTDLSYYLPKPDIRGGGN